MSSITNTTNSSTGTSRRIYLASSWRNEHQPRIVALLRAAGHEVYDFRNPPGRAGFGWEQLEQTERQSCPPKWQRWTPDEYVEALRHPIAEAGFAADFEAMQWADTCVLLLPAGASAALELGWCAGAGRDTIVHVAGLREAELMYKVARAFTTTDDELLQELRKPMQPMSVATIIRAASRNWVRLPVDQDPNARTDMLILGLLEWGEQVSALLRVRTDNGVSTQLVTLPKAQLAAMIDGKGEARP